MTETPSVRRLERVIPAGDREPQDRTRHPMRVVTEGVAVNAGSWTALQAGEVRGYFDELATDWNRRFVDDPRRLAPLEDAIARADIDNFGRCLDLGSGTGMESPLLDAHFREVVAVDLSHSMLRQAPDHPPRVQADGSRLPFGDGQFDVVVLVNALLFGAEMARLIALRGTLLWISSVGADTPIYLPADDVATSLGVGWSGVQSEAGDGTWAALRRVAGA